MITLDASVHVSAVSPHEPASAASQALLRLIRERQIPLFCPTLLPIEVAAAMARREAPERALALASLVRDWPGQSLVPIEGAVADRAADLVAHLHLRSADAVYAAVAQQFGTILVTLDRQQLERLPPHVAAVEPAAMLAQLEPEH